MTGITSGPTPTEGRKWKPRKGDLVRCLKKMEYFSAGDIYRVAKAPQRGCVGMLVYESLGYPVLVGVKDFEPVKAASDERGTL